MHNFLIIKLFCYNTDYTMDPKNSVIKRFQCSDQQTHFTIKGTGLVYEIQPTYRPSTQASYTIGSGNIVGILHLLFVCIACRIGRFRTKLLTYCNVGIRCLSSLRPQELLLDLRSWSDILKMMPATPSFALPGMHSAWSNLFSMSALNNTI